MDQLTLNYPQQKRSQKVSFEIRSLLINSRCKIKSVIPKEILGSQKNYRITGGSTIDGTPMNKLVTTTVKKVKILSRKRNKKVKVASTFVDFNTAALNLVSND